MAKLETAKKEQDYLIDGLQETLKQLHQQLQLYEAQHAAQQAETHAARSTLKEAEAEMEAIHFEKKQLVQQWKSSLIGIARRDEALQATEAALRAQHEQEASIVTEMQGYRRALKEVQAHNEQVWKALSPGLAHSRSSPGLMLCASSAHHHSHPRRERSLSTGHARTRCTYVHSHGGWVDVERSPHTWRAGDGCAEEGGDGGGAGDGVYQRVPREKGEGAGNVREAEALARDYGRGGDTRRGGAEAA